MIIKRYIMKKRIFVIILTVVCIILGSNTSLVRAQFFSPYSPYSPYSLNPFFPPCTLFQCRLMNPLGFGRFTPTPVMPSPILAPPYPIMRRGAVTTTPLVPTLTAPPTLLLLSLLFSTPTTSTTITTGTGVSPNVFSNNVNASPVPNLNSVPSVTTPVLPGISSLFLPLLI